MKFSHFAGIALVPLLARLVLFAAFMPQGYLKVFTDKDFEGEAAQTLSELGIGQPINEPLVSAESGFVLASYQPVGSLQERPSAEQSDPPEAGQDPEPQDPEVQDPPPAAAADAAAEPPTSPADTSWDGRPVRAKKLHGVTAMLVGAGWPQDWQPGAMAWVAAVTELVGGGLLLLGLFSRIWGLGLTIAMGFAFYLTSWPATVDPNLFDLAKDIPLFQQVYLQLGLLVLAFGVCLTGPGPLSVDRLFFGRRSNYEAAPAD